MKNVRRPLVALGAAVVLVAIQAVLDPTGLLALVGWSGALPALDRGLWPWAPYLVYIPILLAVVWWAAVRAGDRFWTLVPGVVLAVLLAQAGTALAMTGDLATAAWAAGYVTAKAVPAALLIAGATRLFGGRAEKARHPYSSVWPSAIVYGALAPLLAGLFWTGAVYAPGVPAPRADRGAISMIAGMLLLAAATALCLRWMRARVPGLLGGWLAAVVAGGVLGLAQALVALVVDGGFTGELWPLMAAYVTVADGLAFGAAAGWIVGLLALVGDRVLADRPVRVSRLVTVSATALAVVVALVVSLAPAPAHPTAAAPAGFLRADGTAITDGNGDQVLLRGVNVNQLVDFYQPREGVATTRPLTEDDFAGMAAQGFDVVRLGLSWSALEPERGTLDARYLARIHQAVEWAKEHGIYVVLDMHQDAWWAGATPEGTDCRPGTDPTWGYDGAPGWATIADGAPRCSFQGRDISPAGDRAFENFYFDTDGVQSALVETWGRLAAEFRDEPAVAGFDLLNEPGFGETAPVTTSYLLGRFYDRAIAAIRDGGAPQIVFVEPSILWSGLGFDSGPRPAFTADPNIVFSPHLYAESITMDRALGLPPITSTERQFVLAARVAAEYGAPLWIGEYGYWGDLDDREAHLARYAKAEDEHLLGSAYWVWKQACGDPQNGEQAEGDGLMVQDCATGGDAAPRQGLLDILSRAYPQSAPGSLVSLSAEGATLKLTGTTADRACGLRVWIPGEAQPDVSVTAVDDIAYTAVDGGWIVTGCAEGDYSLSTGS